jgi:hypothetical protein
VKRRLGRCCHDGQPGEVSVPLFTPCLLVPVPRRFFLAFLDSQGRTINEPDPGFASSNFWFALESVRILRDRERAGTPDPRFHALCLLNLRATVIVLIVGFALGRLLYYLGTEGPHSVPWHVTHDVQLTLPESHLIDPKGP